MLDDECVRDMLSAFGRILPFYGMGTTEVGEAKSIAFTSSASLAKNSEFPVILNSDFCQGSYFEGGLFSTRFRVRLVPGLELESNHKLEETEKNPRNEFNLNYESR